MLGNYWDADISQRKIDKALHVYRNHSGLTGAFIQDLGILLINKGFEVTIHHYDWNWWNKETQEGYKKGPKQLLGALKLLKSEKTKWAYKKIVDKEIRFVKLGGKFDFTLPSAQALDSLLAQQIPPVVLVQAEFLYHQPKEEYTHSIIVLGKENQNYLINDPLYAVTQVPQEELFLAWIRAGAWMLSAKPLKQKPFVQTSLLG